MQTGLSLPFAKVGARVAYLAGRQDHYRWREDDSRATKIDTNFAGSYAQSDWSSTTREGMFNVYANIPWIRSDRFTLGGFALMGYEGSKHGLTRSDNPDIANSIKDRVRGVVVELAPNIAVPFKGAFGYIDAAVDMEYRYSRYDNTTVRSVEGGQVETYRDTRTGVSDERSWEDFSYANRNNVYTGFDLSTMFPLLDGGAHRLGLGLRLLFDSRFTFMTKYYGSAAVQGADVDFEIDNRREDYEREVRFSTGIKAQYRHGPLFAWFEITEPVLKALKPRTRVTDAEGDVILFEHEKDPLWMSLEGLRVGLFVTYEMTLPFLR
ncbi:MAG: hypothetical protein GF344_16950 [Chitinivibrionales bacterium]|nr:hypothetical protein [Chitinivibrionales bacterium]MBD3358371.1 hypothetical protein [Chitinivibrionales bacterium]